MLLCHSTPLPRLTLYPLGLPPVTRSSLNEKLRERSTRILYVLRIDSVAQLLPGSAWLITVGFGHFLEETNEADD